MRLVANDPVIGPLIGAAAVALLISGPLVRDRRRSRRHQDHPAERGGGVCHDPELTPRSVPLPDKTLEFR